MPEDIRILWTKEVPNDFHARFSAHKKTYVYRLKIDDTESPFDFQYTTYFVGQHDFQTFCSANTTTPDFIRTIYYLNITKTNNLYEFEICGNGFLYNMVRIIVGTLVDVGRGKINENDIKNIFESKNRQKAGKTMPAKGLILKKVDYSL